MSSVSHRDFFGATPKMTGKIFLMFRIISSAMTSSVIHKIMPVLFCFQNQEICSSFRPRGEYIISENYL